MAQAQGLAFEVLSPSEAQALYPFLELHDLQGALWDPLDGDIDPSSSPRPTPRARATSARG